MDAELVTYTEYQGHPIIQLKRNELDEHPFQFGAGKAQLVVKHFEKVKEFAEKHKK